MFNFSTFIRSLFVFVVIFAVLFAVTKFSSSIKQQVSGVLGVKVAEKSPPLPENLQKEAGASLDGLKNQAMHTDLQDVADTTAKVNKVVKDYQAFQKEVEKRVNEFFKKNEQEKEEK